MTTQKLLFLTLLIIFSCIGELKSATLTWTGEGDGISWNDPNNWEDGMGNPKIPTTVDDVDIVYLNGAETIVIDVNSEANSIIIEPGGTLQITKSVLLNVDHFIFIKLGATLQNLGGIIDAVEIDVLGSLENDIVDGVKSRINIEGCGTTQFSGVIENNGYIGIISNSYCDSYGLNGEKGSILNNYDSIYINNFKGGLIVDSFYNASDGVLLIDTVKLEGINIFLNFHDYNSIHNEGIIEIDTSNIGVNLVYGEIINEGTISISKSVIGFKSENAIINNTGNLLIKEIDSIAIRNENLLYNFSGLIDIKDCYKDGIQNIYQLTNLSEIKISNIDSVGIRNTGIFYNDGDISIEGVDSVAIYNLSYFENNLSISIKNQGGKGIINESLVPGSSIEFKNNSSINIDNIQDTALINHASFENKSVVFIKNSPIVGLSNDGTFDNLLNGQLLFHNLFPPNNHFVLHNKSSGTVNNSANISIVEGGADAIKNDNVFNNSKTIFVTDVNNGIVNYGTIENLGKISFSQINLNVLTNYNSFINSDTVKVENSDSFYGIFNLGNLENNKYWSFNNSCSLGIDNNGTFTNNVNATFVIDGVNNTPATATLNNKGSLINHGEIQLSNRPLGIWQKSSGTFENTGHISTQNISDFPFSAELGSTFDNSGTMDIQN